LGPLQPDDDDQQGYQAWVAAGKPSASGVTSVPSQGASQAAAASTPSQGGQLLDKPPPIFQASPLGKGSKKIKGKSKAAKTRAANRKKKAARMPTLFSDDEDEVSGSSDVDDDDDVDVRTQVSLLLGELTYIFFLT
jgi:hypothetical protein